MQLQDLLHDIENTGATLNEIAVYQSGEIQTLRLRPGDNCSNSYSVSKAFVMTALGMLSDDGMLDVKKTVAHYMGDLLPKDADPAWKIVTIENTITHKVGYDEGFLDIDVDDVNAYPTDDYLEMVFRHPIKHLPGQHYQYSDAAYYLLSRLVTAVSG